MASKRSDIHKTISGVLEDAGVRYEFRGGGRHPKVILYVSGRTVSYTFSTSPSCPRSTKNFVADWRRILREHGYLDDGDLFSGDESNGPLIEADTGDQVPAVVEPTGEVRVVEFNGARIETMMVDGDPHAAMKPIVEGMGLQWEAQLKRIKRDPNMNTCMSMTDMQVGGQRRQVTTLPLRMLPGFLQGIDANRVKPEIRDRVIAWQREGYDALAAYWFTGGAVKTDNGAVNSSA